MDEAARRRIAVGFIERYWEEYWTSPSYSEIGAAVGYASKASVHRLLKGLVRDGVLEMKVQTSGHRQVLYRVRRSS